jgi:methyltransferase
VSLIPHWLVAAVALERLFELWLARRNTARLLAAGAYEVGASHYPLIVILHVAWIASGSWSRLTPPYPGHGSVCMRFWSAAAAG